MTYNTDSYRSTIFTKFLCNFSFLDLNLNLRAIIKGDEKDSRARLGV